VSTIRAIDAAFTTAERVLGWPRERLPRGIDVI
jgi:hypothetical protein